MVRSIVVVLALLPIFVICQQEEANPCPICFKLEQVPTGTKSVCMPDPTSAECAEVARPCEKNPCAEFTCTTDPNAICRSGAFCEPHFYNPQTFEEVDCIGRCSQIKCPTKCHRCAILLGMETCVIDNTLPDCSTASACMPNPCVQCQTCESAPGKPEHLVPPLNYMCTAIPSCKRDGQCPSSTDPPTQDDCIGPCVEDGDCPFNTKCCQSCCQELPTLPMANGAGKGFRADGGTPNSGSGSAILNRIASGTPNSGTPNGIQ